MSKEVERARQLVEGGAYSGAEQLLGLVSPPTPESLTLRGIVCAKTDRLEEAAYYLEEALAREPDRLEALNWLGMVRRSRKDFQGAIPPLQRSLALEPDNEEVLNLLGLCQISIGEADGAETTFRNLLRLRQNAPVAHYNLGLALRLQNRGLEALEEFKVAAELDPNPQNYLQLFKQLQQLSKWPEAVAALEEARSRFPMSLPILESLAASYGRVGREPEADTLFRSIYRASPRAANRYASWLQEIGRFDDAIRAYEESLRLDPLQGAPYRVLAESNRSELFGRPLLETVSELIKDSRVVAENAPMHLRYALGRLLDRAGNYREAMRNFDEANAIAYRTYPACRTFDPAWTAREPEAMAELYTPDFFRSVEGRGGQDSRPIFIVGMIRSGTTLLDQIVSSHPLVASVGEGAFWNAEADPVHGRLQSRLLSEEELQALAGRYLESVRIGPDQGRFTDKMPLNYRHLGLIHAVFPKAKILHIRRDPFDTCLSIYTTFFAGGPNFAYNQANIVAFYRAYLRFMAHWRSVLPNDLIFELDYERLVTDPQPLVRELLEFLDLDWNEACLRHNANQSPISTPTRWQARQPIYTTSLNKRPTHAPFAGLFNEL